MKLIAISDAKTRTGNLVLTSFQLPWRDGDLAYTGLLGEALSAAEGYDAARICALNGIAQLKDAAGELDRVTRVVRLEGHVGCSPDFTEITVDLEACQVRAGTVVADFSIDDYTRWRLLEGLDDIGLTLRHADDITSFEAGRAAWLPTTA